MTITQPMNNSEYGGIIRTARELLSGRFQGVLSTHSVDHEGYPFGSLLPYSVGRDGWPLMLMSDLARHSKNLLTDPRCSLTIVEQGDGDCQRLTRLSCLADAVPLREVDRQLAERHFRYFPESRAYYEELNFRFYRLQPTRFYCVAGFGTARWLGRDRMEAGNPLSYHQESELLRQIMERFRDPIVDTLSRIYRGAVDRQADALAAGIDPLGLDLKQGGRLFRISFPHPVASPGDLLTHPDAWLDA